MDGVKAMLERLQASYIVVGHTVASTTDVTVRFENRVFLLDTGMLQEAFHGRATALEVRDGRFTAYHADGTTSVLPSPPARSPVPAGLEPAEAIGRTR